MLQLPDQWAPYLRGRPEAGMGYQVVAVLLADGRRFPRALVVGGVLTRIEGTTSIPFAASDIAELIVTNDVSWL